MSPFTALSSEDLVRMFAEIAKKRGIAVRESDTRRHNQMFRRMQAIERVLRSRGDDVRMLLLPLLDSDDRFVRYYAARYLIALAPERSRQVIEYVASHSFDALALDAGMTLYSFDNGIFRPD